MILAAILVFLSVINGLTAQNVIKFGAFFDSDDADLLEIFEIAISRQNAFNVQFRLEPITRQIVSMDSFQAEQAVCEMVESGAVAIVGPKSIYISDVIASICNELNIPHIVSHHRIPEPNVSPFHKFTRNIYPDIGLLSNALVDIVQNYEWKKFAVIYDTDESLLRLNDVLQMFGIGYKQVTVYKYPGKEMARSFLKDIAKTMENRIIIDCSIENSMEIIKQGLEVRMMDEYMTYFITSVDGHMIDLSNLKEVRSNITAVRLMSATDVEAMNIVKQWKENKKYLNAEQFKHAEHTSYVQSNRLRIEAALIRDIITLLSNSLFERKLFRRIGVPPTQCDLMNYDSMSEDMPQYWKQGRELLQNMDYSNKIAGITGSIRFNTYYKTREDFYMEIVELERPDFTFKKVAEWNFADKLIVTRSFEELLSQKAATIQSKTFIVISRIGMPYLEMKQNTNGTKLYGNDQYEGFSKDLMDEIARVKNFKYRLVLVSDNHYGNHDPITNKWNGMIGEILEGRADLAIGDFTITYERKTVIDFSSPFLTLGISILYAKPVKTPPGLLSFLKPLDTGVWLYMSTAFLCISLVLFVLAKITEADWENPHPCNDEPEELENIWNMHNCIWLTVGSIMQQGCDILPKGLPTRLAAASWWFFALIVISSYTANLAAFLTKEQMEDSIESVEDLSKESKIKYGLLGGGSTETFFKDSNVSIYQKMWATMEHAEPSVFVESNEEGIERVKQSNRGYAFLMESSTIEYIIQTECNLTRIGGWLDSKAYGIGMPMNSPFRDDINEAILLLKEDRTVQHLKEKWWITNNIRIRDGEQINCTKEIETNVDTPELDMGNVGGIFIVLLIGFIVSILVGVLEFLWNVRKVSISEKITPYEALQKELIFACKFWITEKPIIELSDESISMQSVDDSLEKNAAKNVEC